MSEKKVSNYSLDDLKSHFMFSQDEPFESVQQLLHVAHVNIKSHLYHLRIEQLINNSGVDITQPYRITYLKDQMLIENVDLYD